VSQRKKEEREKNETIIFFVCLFFFFFFSPDYAPARSSGEGEKKEERTIVKATLRARFGL